MCPQSCQSAALNVWYVFLLGAPPSLHSGVQQGPCHIRFCLPQLCCLSFARHAATLPQIVSTCGQGLRSRSQAHNQQACDSRKVGATACWVSIGEGLHWARPMALRVLQAHSSPWRLTQKKAPPKAPLPTSLQWACPLLWAALGPGTQRTCNRTLMQAAQCVAQQAAECVAALEALMAEKQGMQAQVCVRGWRFWWHERGGHGEQEVARHGRGTGLTICCL